MMNLIICTLAALLHCMFRLTVFVEPVKTQTKDDTKTNINQYGTSSSILPSTLVVFTICIALADANIFSERYARRSTVPFRLFIESIAAFILIEIGMVMIWSRLEQLVAWIVCMSCCGGYPDNYKEEGGEALTTTFLLAISFTLLVNTLMLTEIGGKIYGRFIIIWKEWISKVIDVWYVKLFRSRSAESERISGKTLAMQGAGDGLDTNSKSAKLIPEPDLELKSANRKKYLCLICEQRDCSM